MYGVAASTLRTAGAACATLVWVVTSDSDSASASSVATTAGRLAATRSMGGCAVRARAERHQLLGELCFDHADHRSAHRQRRTEVALGREQASPGHVECRAQREVRSARDSKSHA